MELDNRSKYLRRLAVRTLKGGNRGHIGSTMSLIEIMRVLYDDIANKKKDKIILSKGHGCIAQYIMLADKGCFPFEELDKFCKPEGILGGHPSPDVPGIECHTGALGHGLSIGIGMALAAKIRKQDHRIFVIMGDGEINEGSVWEAAMSAAKHKLDNLTVIIDYNKIQSAGFVQDICPLEPLVDKFLAFGFEVYTCSGHSIEELKLTVGTGPFDKLPQCIIAHTIKGKGIPFAEGKPEWHHRANFTPQQIRDLEACLV